MNFDRTMTSTVYIVNDKKVLLHLHKKYNTWFAVGGHIKADELPHQAAVREVFEETGAVITLEKTEHTTADLVNVEQLPLPFMLCREGIGSDEEFMDFVFVSRTRIDKINPQKDESRQFKWFTKAELLEDKSLKPHIKNTALCVLEYLENRG